MDANAVAFIGFASLFALMMLRVPVGIAMGTVGVLGFGYMIGDIRPALKILSQSPIRTATDAEFAVIPLFLLMGAFASASGMSRELFRASNTFLGHLRGGLGVATIAACGGFAAICGSSVATAATFSKVAYPEMRQVRLSAELLHRRDRRRRLARHHDPALHRVRGLRADHRAGHRQAVHRRHHPRHPRGRHVYRHHQPDRLLPPRLPAQDAAPFLGRAHGIGARHLGGGAAVHLRDRRALCRHVHRHRSRRHGRVRRLHHRGGAAQALARRFLALPDRIACAPRRRCSPS